MLADVIKKGRGNGLNIGQNVLVIRDKATEKDNGGLLVMPLDSM